MVISDEQDNEEAMEFMEAIHDLYAAEKGTLIRAYQQRERAKKERKEFLRLNPPKPEDFEISFWNNDENVSK